MTVAVVQTSHRAELELGPPITAAGLVRWLSASAVVKFDPNSEGGCPLRGWFHYVGSLLGISLREPETPAMSAGTGMHKEIEGHLKTGAMTLGPIALGGRHFIDEPGPGLDVEFPIIEGGFGEISRVHLRIAGVPYAGHLDLFNHRGAYIDAQGDVRQDAPGTLECKDWKSTSDLKWAKNPEQVANAIPMTGYAMAGFAIWPEYERVRLTHVYFSRGKHGALLSTARRERAQVERRWEYATGIARSIIDIAREVDPNKIPVNTNACYSYNQLCPHFALCSRGRAAQKQTTLASRLGPRLAALLTGNVRAALGQTDVDDTIDIFQEIEEPDMGLLKNVGKNTAPTPPAESVSIEDLLDEEAAERDAVAEAPREIAAAPPTEEFKKSWEIIGGSGLGTPTLIGLAANMLLTWRGEKNTVDARVAGDGKLAGLEPIADPIKINELGRQIAAKLAKTRAPAPVAPPIALLPADAPASNPALAADPVEGLDNERTRALETARSAVKAIAIETPVVETKEQYDARTGTTRQTVVLEPSEQVASPAKTRAARKPAPTPTVAASGGPVTSTSIYMDVSVDGIELKLLDGYVMTVAGELCTIWGCKDVRLAGNDTPGGYGKGSAFLVATCLEVPPPPGVYFVDSRANPLVEAVAVALRQTCLASGGVFVRGIR